MEKTTIEFNKSTLWKGLAGILAVAAVFMFLKGNLGFGGNSGLSGNTVAASDNGLVEVRTTLQNFQYNPDTITVKKGSQVRLVIDNKDNVNHGLHLPQFGIQDGIAPNSVKTVTFTAVENRFNGQAIPTCTREHGETLTFNVV